MSDTQKLSIDELVMHDESNGHGANGVTRRVTLQVSAILATLPILPSSTVEAQPSSQLTIKPVVANNTVKINTIINAQSFDVEVDTRTSLLDLLRERFNLTGAKKGCDHGQCGACTVHIDRRRVASCLTLAAKVDGCEVLTIEGLSKGARLHPMQQAFIDHDALQCGYCTPGQIMAAVACVAEGNATSKERIREYMSGNICRCGAYVGIVAAIEDAAPKMGRS